MDCQIKKYVHICGFPKKTGERNEDIETISFGDDSTEDEENTMKGIEDIIHPIGRDVLNREASVEDTTKSYSDRGDDETPTDSEIEVLPRSVSILFIS